MDLTKCISLLLIYVQACQSRAAKIEGICLRAVHVYKGMFPLIHDMLSLRARICLFMHVSRLSICDLDPGDARRGIESRVEFEGP